MLASKMLRRGLTAGAAIVMLGLPIVQLGLAASNGGEDSPPPPPATVTELEDPVYVEGMDILLEPPPSSLKATTTAEEALAIAWAEEGRADATSATATLALFTSSQVVRKEAPTWIVTYAGVCIPIYGPITDETTDDAKTQECAATELNVIIDAATGEFVAAYSIG